jgi:hypothetical protein
MSIKNYLDELDKLREEIKNNNIRNRALRQRIKELEYNITDYLNEKGQQGLKYKGKALIIEQKEMRLAKKKKDKENDVISLLEELGVDDAQNVYLRIIDRQKGEPIEQKKIKFKKLPNFKNF